MKKIILIDYYGNCDALGKSVGHSPKVLDEYRELIQGIYEVEAFLPQCIIDEIDCKVFTAVHRLPYQIIEEGNRNILKRVFDKIKLFINTSETLHKADGDILWFYRTDFFLFLYMFLHRKYKKSKLLCLVCQQKFAEGKIGNILNYIYQKGLQKFDGVIYTQKGMKPQHNHIFYMPDYYYDSPKYGKYLDIKKEKKVVCLGTMSPYKKLEELVEVFNKNSMPLEIVGKFYDKKRVERLKKNANNNILIQNRILTEEEYYRKLAEALYIILPYDMQQYVGRTSGVLIEALFVQTIPIAPSDLLKENGLKGIGYESLQELINFDVFESNEENLPEMLKKELQRYPAKRELEDGIVNFINNI